MSGRPDESLAEVLARLGWRYAPTMTRLGLRCRVTDADGTVLGFMSAHDTWQELKRRELYPASACSGTCHDERGRRTN